MLGRPSVVHREVHERQKFLSLAPPLGLHFRPSQKFALTGGVVITLPVGTSSWVVVLTAELWFGTN